MENLTFEQLPKAVSLVIQKLETIENLLLSLVRNKEPPPYPDNLLTITQAAEIESLSLATIYGLVSRREIQVSKRRKRLYFSREELVEWVGAGRKKTNAEIEAEAGMYLSTIKRRKRF